MPCDNSRPPLLGWEAYSGTVDGGADGAARFNRDHRWHRIERRGRRGRKSDDRALSWPEDGVCDYQRGTCARARAIGGAHCVSPSLVLPRVWPLARLAFSSGFLLASPDRRLYRHYSHAVCQVDVCRCCCCRAGDKLEPVAFDAKRPTSKTLKAIQSGPARWVGSVPTSQCPSYAHSCAHDAQGVCHCSHALPGQRMGRRSTASSCRQG